MGDGLALALLSFQDGNVESRLFTDLFRMCLKDTRLWTRWTAFYKVRCLKNHWAKMVDLVLLRTCLGAKRWTPIGDPLGDDWGHDNCDMSLDMCWTHAWRHYWGHGTRWPFIRDVQQRLRTWLKRWLSTWTLLLVHYTCATHAWGHGRGDGRGH